MQGSSFDIAVVGGGHAGIEASLAAARLGCRVLLVTHAKSEIGRMPCNPAIGGLGKGHLVREIDVLGGQMALAIDATGIQFRILNRRKGPAVQSPRAQADKREYQNYMLRTVLDEPNLQILEDEAKGLIVESGNAGRQRVVGIKTATGADILCDRVILSTGTFLRGLMHVGDRRSTGGREGAASSEGLSADLVSHGFRLRRLKTGTPPRLRHDTVDYSSLQPQSGDQNPQPFSFRTERFEPDQVLCHQTYTNAETHRIIRANLERSPLYGGIIEGTGPRYCPSIEDKVVRFAGKGRHLVFLEPEGRTSSEVYVNGLATSLPGDVQTEVIHSIEGLHEAEIVRFGYAVEYDSIPSYQVQASLESKVVDGLYLAGQIIGTSGYEEAGAQGLMAGINAYCSLNNQPPLILKRSEGYIGVLIDDLVTKDISEPYRMFTSRAEHRLALRCDNAEARLLRASVQLGLLPQEDLQRMRERVSAVQAIARRFHSFMVTDPISGERTPAAKALKRPNVDLMHLVKHTPEGKELECAIRKDIEGTVPADHSEVRAGDLLHQAEIEIKYAGYIAKQDKLLEKQKYLDNMELPMNLDYRSIQALSLEAREKLAVMRPATLGQASRIDGVRAGDLAVLSVVLRKQNREKRPPRKIGYRPQTAEKPGETDSRGRHTRREP